MPDESNGNGWDEWKRFVLPEIEELKKSHKELNDKFDTKMDAIKSGFTDFKLEMVKQITEIQTKDSVLCRIKASIPGLLVTVIALLTFYFTFLNGKG